MNRPAVFMAARRKDEYMEYKVSDNIVTIRCGENVILYNRMLGGVITISDVLYKTLLNNYTIDADLRKKLSLNNIVFDKHTDESDLIERLKIEELEKATSGNALRCLELSVSEECNYTCVYCKFWRHRNDQVVNLMSKATCFRVLNDFLSLVDSSKLSVYMGTAEALLNWEVVKYATNLIRNTSKNVRISLITNGSIMTREILEFCKLNDISIGVSLDGRPRLQRSQRRPVSPTIDSSKVIIDLIDYAKRIKFGLKCISCTFSSIDFCDDVKYVVELCKKNGIPEIDIDYDTGALLDNKGVSEISDELVRCYSIATNAGLYVFGNWLVPYYNITNSNGGIKSFCGNTIGKSICISADGGFKLCGYQEEKIEPYTAIKNHLSSALTRKIFKSRLPGNLVSCRDCEIEGVCVGQCMLTEKQDDTWIRTRDLYKKTTKTLLMTKEHNPCLPK